MCKAAFCRMRNRRTVCAFCSRGASNIVLTHPCCLCGTAVCQQMHQLSSTKSNLQATIHEVQDSCGSDACEGHHKFVHWALG